MSGGEVEGVIAAGETAIVADAAAAELRPGAQGRIGQPCANCGATLQGQHCHVCGQLADDLHRPIWALIHDALEGLFSLDGRFLRTVPALLFRPGRVSATYIAGGRARFVQPFRLYLFSSLAFLLAVSIVAGDWTDVNFDGAPGRGFAQTERQLDRAADLTADPEAVAEIDRARDEIAAAREARERATPEEREQRLAEQRREAKCGVRRQLLPEDLGTCPAEAADDDRPSEFGVDIADGDMDVGFSEAMLEWPIGVRRHLVRQAEIVIDDPSRFLEAVNRWISRVLISLFPVYALLLGLMNFWKRRLFYYDHIIVSLHFHAFLFLLLTMLIAASAIAPIALLCLVFFVWSNLYVYKVHRLVYGSGRITAVLRTLVLDFLYLIILSFVPIVLVVGGFLTA